MFQALSSKASDLINAQAGLLTRFRYKHLPGNYPSGYWHFAYAFSETYSSGTVQDSGENGSSMQNDSVFHNGQSQACAAQFA